MKNQLYIIFTAGRGPDECGLAVDGVQKKFRTYLESTATSFEVISQKKGSINQSIETIVFKVTTDNRAMIDPWLGSIQWICQSPIRKSHKRKNWFIKCQEIKIPKKLEIDINDIDVQTYRASGPGGQHRNKVETAIRVIHNQTGIIVTASDGKSQSQNKKKAMQKLMAKLESQNELIQQGFNTDRWTSQLEIERGNPAKTFNGLKFKEC